MLRLLSREARFRAERKFRIFSPRRLLSGSRYRLLFVAMAQVFQYVADDRPMLPIIPNLSHLMLAQMVGAARSRVMFFMNRSHAGFHYPQRSGANLQLPSSTSSCTNSDLSCRCRADGI
jgi:hypothetical protein